MVNKVEHSHIEREFINILNRVRFSYVLDSSGIIQMLSKMINDETFLSNGEKIDSIAAGNPEGKPTDTLQKTDYKMLNGMQNAKRSIQSLAGIEEIHASDLKQIYSQHMKEEREKVNKKTITKEQIKGALQVNKKLTDFQLAYIFDVPRYEVTGVLKENGIVASVPMTAKTIERLMKVEYLIVNSFMPREEIAKELGVVEPTIGRDVAKLKSQGRLNRDFSFQSIDIDEKVKNLEVLIKKTTWTKKAISLKVELSYKSIDKYVDILKAKGRIGENFGFGRRRMMF